MKPDAFKFTAENKMIKISERYIVLYRISISGQEMESQVPPKYCYLPTKLYCVRTLYNHRRERLKSQRKLLFLLGLRHPVTKPVTQGLLL
jgi:hypothetical protein